MTDEVFKLNVRKRQTGKAGKTELSASDVRGVVYGKEVESTPVVADFNELNKLFNKAGTNNLIDMEIEGGDTHEVLFKELDFDPVSNDIRHFDMYAIKRGEKVQVEVPIELVGDSEAVKKGLNLVTITEQVEVTTVPRKIPSSFEINVEALAEVGDTVTVADIKVTDEEIEITTDAETVVAKVEEIQEMKVEEEGPTEMPGEEGEEGEGEESAEGESSEGSEGEKSEE